jgi:hypothetical protein
MLYLLFSIKSLVLRVEKDGGDLKILEEDELETCLEAGLGTLLSRPQQPQHCASSIAQYNKGTLTRSIFAFFIIFNTESVFF